MVLAVEASEITASTSDGEAGRAGVKMIERLFLYGVNGDGAGMPIDLADEPTVHIAAAAAQSRLPG